MQETKLFHDYNGSMTIALIKEEVPSYEESIEKSSDEKYMRSAIKDCQVIEILCNFFIHDECDELFRKQDNQVFSQVCNMTT